MANESLTLSVESCNVSVSARSSLSNIVVDDSLKWVFVGGKGGSGKTVVGSSLAVSLAKSRQVLLVSIDPAHNLSDVFCRQFGNTPTPLKEVPGLSVMEMDPDCWSGRFEKPGTPKFGKIQTFLSCFPGVKEALAFAKLIYGARNDYETVVFDTAPTGHTVGLLSFLAGLSRLSEFSLTTTDPRVKIIVDLIAADEALAEIIDETEAAVDFASGQLANRKSTTFVCVCTPDFLSICETERLIQDVAAAGVGCRNIVVNQLLEEQLDCKCSCSKRNTQTDYLQHVYDLYEGFHVTELPSVNGELRGVERLKSFSTLLTQI